MSQLSTDNDKNIKLVHKLAQQMYPGNQVLVDLTTVQAILEAGFRAKVPSSLAFKYNNLFGIKGRGTKGSVTLRTKEFVRGKEITIPQIFAWNATVEDSLEQRKKLFENGTRSRPERYHPVLRAKTFEEAATAVYRAGYATDPQYPAKLIDVYNSYVKNLS